MQGKLRQRSWRPLAGAAIVISIAAIAGQSVIASLNATAYNTSAQKVTSGTMSLKFDNTSTRTQFSNEIPNLVPGDVVYRYATLSNNGTISGQNLRLSIAAATGSTATLINNQGSSKALTLTVNSCLDPWVINQSGVAACPNGQTEELSLKTIGALTNPALLGTGNLAAGVTKYLQMKLELPDQDELTINGTPSGQTTIQNGTVNLTYTFDLAQRTAGTTNN